MNNNNNIQGDHLYIPLHNNNEPDAHGDVRDAHELLNRLGRTLENYGPFSHRSRARLLALLMCAVGCVVLIAYGIKPDESKKDPDHKNNFDIYLFAQSWQPEFCYKKNYPGCTPDSYGSHHLTIHGLWPEYSEPRDGSMYPQFCNFGSPWDPKIISDDQNFLQDLLKYWPNVMFQTSDNRYDDFWEHEWSKHGRCTTLSQKKYMDNALHLEMILGTPRALVGATSNIKKSVLQDAYDYKVGIQCKSNFLQAVYSCWKFDGDDIPTFQIDCPDRVLQDGLDSCQSIIYVESIN